MLQIVSTAAAIAVMAIIGNGTAQAAQPISGPAQILDADTVIVAGTKIRFTGVDAPESDQICFTASGARETCGIRARDALAARLGSKPWTCTLTGKKTYDRELGACTADGIDVQRWLVQQGLALSFVRYAHTYDADEAVARETKAGLWAGCFIAPWEWRTRSKKTVLLGSVCPSEAQRFLLDPDPFTTPPDPNCRIKANTRSGECIYHEPGSRYYQKLTMGPGKGKRWFCTVAEAEASGCRAPRR